MEQLHEIKADLGIENAATLLIVSGHPLQEAVKQLSQHQVGLPPLSTSDRGDELSFACLDAFNHMGPARCVASCINGGGKTHSIMKRCAERQKLGELIAYVRIPIRESTTPQTLVSMLTASRNKFRHQGKSIFYHLDIGHIIPPSANTMLFELIVLGLVRDPVNQRVFQRRSSDTFDIEIPNSINNKTAQALYFTKLLPTVVLECSPDTLDFEVAVARGNTGDVALEPYDGVFYNML